jgi:hypothetical protein
MISLSVMLIMFFIGVGASQLWRNEWGLRELNKLKVDAAPQVSTLKDAPKASECGWLRDSKLSKDPGWSAAKAKRSVAGGVLDSKVCHVEMNYDGLILKATAVSFSPGSSVEPLVNVTLDSKGFVREAKVIKKYDPIPDKVLVEEAFKVRMLPVKLGGDPTVIKGVLTSQFFDQVVLGRAL